MASLLMYYFRFTSEGLRPGNRGHVAIRCKDCGIWTPSAMIPADHASSRTGGEASH